jgi:hypothetical protein
VYALVVMQAAVEVYDEPQIDEGELADMKKWRVPMPPSQDHKAYRAWKKKLPAVVRTRIDTYCWHFGGEPRLTCNGVGPYAIPLPGEPSTAPDPSRTGFGWEESLTRVQRRYYESYCGVNLPPAADGTPARLDHLYSPLCGGTPLVLAFDNERVAYTASSITMDWPTSATPWIVLDANRDGAIAMNELFGSAMSLANGTLAKNGFQALAELDANGDRVLDARDPMFARLQIWSDTDGNRQSSSDELTALSARVESISLDSARQPYCDARHDCEGERSAMTWRDASGAIHAGAVIDVYLSWR